MTPADALAAANEAMRIDYALHANRPGDPYEPIECVRCYVSLQLAEGTEPPALCHPCAQALVRDALPILARCVIEQAGAREDLRAELCPSRVPVRVGSVRGRGALP